MTHLIMVHVRGGRKFNSCKAVYFLVVTKCVNNVLHDERKNLDKPELGED